MLPASLSAQQLRAVYVAGNAAVSGFSGALPPVQIAPGVDPSAQTFIDLNGPSLRVIDLHRMGGPPQAQLVGAPKPFTVSAASIGQVFGVALDDSTPANIYAAATSAYGLPIVAPAADGRPRQIRAGAPSATFMQGLWGPQGGAGSIWKIDGKSGKVSLFANITSNGRANSGAALGGLAYDPDSKSLFVTDRESGLIHRLAMDGRDLGSYDHGSTGRVSQGMPAVPWNSSPGIDIKSPAFDSRQPATWNYAAPERRVFGLAANQHRLYYAVADGLQIWSVGLKGDGSFDDDAAIEFVVPPASGPTEISKITFDEQGRIFLAERPAPTGAAGFEELAIPAIGRVLRYAIVGTAAEGRRIWQEQPSEYAIGFAGDLRNGNGGIAIGYEYDRNGEIMAGSCGGFMWATGEQLRNSPDAALAGQLARSGALNVDGLQGNGTWRIRRNNEPPSMSYFIDYDDDFRDLAARGHLGDVAIARPCTPAQRTGGDFPQRRPAVEPPPGTPPGGTPPPNHPPTNPPASSCPPDQVRRAGSDSCVSCSRPNVQIGGKCCAPGDLAAGGACSNSSCPAGQTAIGPSNFCCGSGQVYTNAGAPACCAGALVNGQCPSPTQPGCTPGSTNPQCCPIGYVSTGNSCCLASQMNSAGVCCPAGQAPSGPNKNQCAVLVKIPRGPQCCAAGLIPAGGGECCAAANVTTTGICCSGPVDPKNRTNCPAQIQIIPKCATGYTRMPDGSCCNDRHVGDNGKSCNAGPPPPKPRAPLIPLVPRRACPSGMTRDSDGDCVRKRSGRRCAPSDIRMDDGTCAASAPAPRFGPGGYGLPYGPPRYFGGPRRFGPGGFGPGRFGRGRFR